MWLLREEFANGIFSDMDLMICILHFNNKKPLVLCLR